jgi:dTDP-4-amino-4,6-dideoxygalactose transaminase
VPKIVIPVDFAGVPAPLPELKQLAEKYGFKLLEDAAHAIGSTYVAEGQTHACGSCAHTDAAVFSFHPVKNITTGEGGAILTNDDRLARTLRKLANHGIERNPQGFRHPPFAEPNTDPGVQLAKSFPPWYHEMQSLGYNARTTDIQCALGLSQLRRLGSFKARRQEIVRKYNRALRPLEDREILVLPPWPADTDPCFHLYPLRLGANSPVGRDTLFETLRRKGIHCQIHYIPIYRQPFYQGRGRHEPADFPQTERYFEACISLPLFPDMNEAVFDRVLEALFSVLDPDGDRGAESLSQR